ncbi:DedA family protein [Amycolatopsis taiwanensis]|uniref:Cytochrome o ubiquinol oxidase n=1 Tax=Amycolatopsis taiwanensis TaxID=342230 RepID=A0A9W6R4I6_9PSEU|nr:VTT domain-containing protein [Amycolatopsis taiwanensis]GLY67345.1 cytochrome o ubiquinol oxidase [Amycolatopsis taiwanensis]
MLAATTTTLALMPQWFNPEYLLTKFGAYVIIGLCLVIFIESSIFPVLPGDSLLFTAGLFVAQGSIQTPLWLVCLVVTLAALLGNVVGYFLGYKVGPALFRRPDSRFFKQEYVDKTHAFLEKHGPKAVVLARFVPFVRTFITWIAGVGRMDPKKYFTYTVIGGIAWAAGITALGHLLGNIPFIRTNIEAIFILIVLVSVIPLVVEWARNRRNRSREAESSAEVTQQIPRVPRDDR